MEPKTHKGGKRNRKHGRNAVRSKSQARYRIEGRVFKNRARRLSRHLKRHPDDTQTAAAIANTWQPRHGI